MCPTLLEAANEHKSPGKESKLSVLITINGIFNFDSDCSKKVKFFMRNSSFTFDSLWAFHWDWEKIYIPITSSQLCNALDNAGLSSILKSFLKF